MKKNTTNNTTSTTKNEAFKLELVVGKKMSEYWSDFQQFSKIHKEQLAAAKAARDAAIREANATFAKVKEAETTAVHEAYLEFQRIQSEFQSSRAERRTTKAEQPVAEAEAEAEVTEVDGISTEGLTEDEIALLKAAS